MPQNPTPARRRRALAAAVAGASLVAAPALAVSATAVELPDGSTVSGPQGEVQVQQQFEDGRYFVVRGRLWRCSNPALPEKKRAALVRELMAARRAVKAALAAEDAAALKAARDCVHKAKVALGERGPAWWDDGAPAYNRRLAVNTPYKDWYEGLTTG